MNTKDIDERLRALCERNTPPFDEDAFIARLRTSARKNRDRPSATKGRNGLRRVAYACMAALLIAAVTFGGLKLSTYLGSDSQIIVFTDDTLGPASGHQSADTGASAGATSVDPTIRIRTGIPGSILYQDREYTHTADRVGLQALPPESLSPETPSVPATPDNPPVPDDLTYAGQACAIAEPTSSADSSAEDRPNYDRPNCCGYEVYTIAGVDPLQAVAVRFVAQGFSDDDSLLGLFFVWIRYERKTTATPDALADDATAEAETVLQEFFQAWAARDTTAYMALLSERHRAGMHSVDEELMGRARVEFGPTDSGQELPWTWQLVRDADGNWKVDDWGA